MNNLAVLADTAAVPSAYDAEALVRYLIQTGVPEPSGTRMMLDVIDELRRRDADHSYPALRALAVIGPPGVAEYAAAAADRLAARDAAPPWIAAIGDVVAGTCYLADSAAGDTTLVSYEFTYADGSKPHAVRPGWLVGWCCRSRIPVAAGRERGLRARCSFRTAGPIVPGLPG